MSRYSKLKYPMLSFAGVVLAVFFGVIIDRVTVKTASLEPTQSSQSVTAKIDPEKISGSGCKILQDRSMAAFNQAQEEELTIGTLYIQSAAKDYAKATYFLNQYHFCLDRTH